MKTYITNLRHCSLHLNIIFQYLKFHFSKHIIKRDILVQKIYVEKSFFKFPTLKLNFVFIHNYMIYIKTKIFSLAIQLYISGVHTLCRTRNIIFRRERGEMTLHHSSLSLSEKSLAKKCMFIKFEVCSLFYLHELMHHSHVCVI